MDDNQNNNQSPVSNDSQEPSSKAPVSGKSVASMICGILSIPTIWVLGWPGFLLAIVAIALSGRPYGHVANCSYGMAKAGRICGIVCIALVIETRLLVLLTEWLA